MDVQEMKNPNQTKWELEFKEDCPELYVAVMEIVTAVDFVAHIFWSDENGYPRWVVAIPKSDIWLNAFLEPSNAVKFCEQMGWKYEI